ncbi:MAG: 50S ribosomal protein L13 [Microgenomates bacterium OLB23]|nr:MAG: 50S ribosomal protein L13 [Microgenomates bacterium OLB23]
MKHGIKKAKFKLGQDANQALVRKLVINFVQQGRLSTTLSKAKVLKGEIDRLVYKASQAKESDKNVLLRELGDKSVVKHMLTVVGPTFNGQVSGFTRMYRMGPRQGDNAEVARLEWVKPINEPAQPTEVVAAKKTEKASKKSYKNKDRMTQLTQLTKSTREKDVKRVWHLIDAHNLVLGRCATQISSLLIGKGKSTYSPNMDEGDYVVVINAKHIKVTGSKELEKNLYQVFWLPRRIKKRRHTTDCMQKIQEK